MTSFDYIHDLFDLRGRRALVTGASRGLGYAFAMTLARAGATAVLAGRDEAALLESTKKLRDEGLEASYAVMDVTDTASVDRAIAATGVVDILVNNAGIQHRAPLEKVADEDWQRVMSTNLDGVFRVSRAVVPGMIERKSGSIINVSSVQSSLARPSIAPYAASKGAITMLTKSMAGEWGQHGIRVNALAPGYFKTDLNSALIANPEFSSWLIGRTPMRRWGEVLELAGALLLLASSASSFIAGQTLVVDGGVTSVL